MFTTIIYVNGDTIENAKMIRSENSVSDLIIAMRVFGATRIMQWKETSFHQTSFVKNKDGVWQAEWTSIGG